MRRHLPHAELQPVSRHTAIWQIFDPSVKADLFSTVISTPEATWLIDPTPLPGAALGELNSRSPIHAIIVTNQNHWRAAGALADELSVPIFAHQDAKFSEVPAFTEVAEGQLSEHIQIIALEGAVAGEIALFSDIDGGTMIVGDALINIEPYGFTFLPKKYCTDFTKLRRSLHRLADFSIQQIFFAHALPILSNAGTRLKGLLNEQG